MIRTCLAGLTTLAAMGCSHVPENAPVLTIGDFAVAAGGGWTGTLTYRDYSPPYSEVTIQAEVDVAVVADGVQFAIRYPREPQENATDVAKISNGGRVFDGEQVVSRVKEGGSLVVVTEGKCEDSGRPALCEHTYDIGDRALRIRKAVRLADGTPAFRRNEYAFSR